MTAFSGTLPRAFCRHVARYRARRPGLARQIGRGLALTGLVVGLVLTAPQPADAQSAATNVCRDLEAELAAMRQPVAQDRTLVREMDRLAREVDDLQNQAWAVGCMDGIFQRPAGCGRILNVIDGKRDRYEALAALSRNGAVAHDPRRERRILAALGANDCGSDYAAYAPVRRAPSLFDSLFGGGLPRAVPQPVPDGGARVSGTIGLPRPAPYFTPGGTYRTVCVRACDGFFWPLSFSTTAAGFSADADRCQSSCPGTDVALYAMDSPLDDPGTMRAVETGAPYSALPNAFRYQKEVVSGCGCPSATERTGATPAAPASNDQASTVDTPPRAEIAIGRLDPGGRLEPDTLALPRPNPKRQSTPAMPETPDVTDTADDARAATDAAEPMDNEQDVTEAADAEPPSPEQGNTGERDVRIVGPTIPPMLVR